MSVNVSLDFDPVILLVVEVTKDAKPVPGSTQKETQMREREWIQRYEDRCNFLAMLLTMKRIEIIAPFMVHEERKWVPAVSGYEVRPVLKEIVRLWQEGEFKDATDEDFYKYVRVTFESQLVYGHGFDKLIHAQRRDLILAGKLDPTPKDREWIEQERTDFAAVVAPYDRALAKITTGG